MKFIHLSDLHIGKRVNEYSMLEDQKYIIKEILNIIDREIPDAVLIAGDVYDKSVPPTQAVELFDEFVFQLAKRKIETFIISGNHDSAERMAFASRLIDASGIHFSPIYNGDVKSGVIKDSYGEVNIYMLPFIRPANVRAVYPDAEINTYTDAVQVAIDNMNVDFLKRNIILSHQFVLGASRCDSEDFSVGGTDGVSASVYEGFDYVALGHLHSPQKIVSENIRYGGTPLKYSFSEVNHKKGVTVVELAEKGNVNVRLIPLIPKRDLVEIKGKYDEIMSKSFYENLNTEDYYHIVLTDEDDVFDAIYKLKTVYKNIMKLDYENTRTRSNSSVDTVDSVKEKKPIDLMAELYYLQNGVELNNEQEEYLSTLIEKIWEGE